MTATDGEYWRQLAEDWTNTEGPGLEQEQWRALFSSPRPGREHLMAPDVRELVAHLPERVRIWRGAVRGVNEAGLSWAVSRDDAVGWAHRNVGIHQGGKPVVLRAAVARKDVIALFVERLEMEILAFPENVTIEAVEDVSGEPAPGPSLHPPAAEIESA